MNRYIVMIAAVLIGALLLQGAGCSSREMTTAKVALSKRDYTRAIEFCEKELAKNPNSEEALMMIVEIKMLTGDYATAAKAIERARKIAKLQQNIEKLSVHSVRLWQSSNNNAIGHYNMFVNTKDRAYVDSAFKYFDIAIKVRPKRVDFYLRKGNLYELIQDTSNAIIEYVKYTEILQPETEFASKYNVYIKMPTKEFISKIGSPERTIPSQSMKGDTAKTDIFERDGQVIYLYSVKEKGKDWEVAGWRVDLPDSWIPNEKSNFSPLITSPFPALAQIFYDRSDFDKALEYIEKLLVFEPNNKEANAYRILLLREMGKTDDAIASLKDLTRSNPGNKFYWANYGDLLSNLDKFDDAIEAYGHALNIDPKYDHVLRNIASAYKNTAGGIQKEQNEKMDKDDKYEPETEKYFPILGKSAEYFERALETKRFQRDWEVLSELANIYLVLDDAEKLDVVSNKLNDIEPFVKKDDKLNYYYRLLKLFSERKMSDETNKIKEKIENFNK